jgi:hypothetical protein
MRNYNVVDAGWLFIKDDIALAEDAGSMPTQGFRPYSNSVKDARLSADTPIRVRVSTQAGVTGGFVADSVEPQRANELSKSARKRARRTGKLPAHWR